VVAQVEAVVGGLALCDAAACEGRSASWEWSIAAEGPSDLASSG